VAFSAAEVSGPIRIEHLIRAAARQPQKHGRLPLRAQFGDYFALLAEHV
jgi:hypothetical protein